jgi:hypothetical protein
MKIGMQQGMGAFEIDFLNENFDIFPRMQVLVPTL